MCDLHFFRFPRHDRPPWYTTPSWVLCARRVLAAPLPPTPHQPEEHDEHAPGRRKSLWAAPAARKVWCSKHHEVIKMIRCHARVTKERVTLRALPTNAPNKIVSVARSPVSLPTKIGEVGQLRELEELIRISAPRGAGSERR